MTYALGTSRRRITNAPLLLIDLETEEGVTGRAYLWCYLRAPRAGDRADARRGGALVKGEPVAPAALWGKLAERFALIGVQGIVRMAMAGLDMAAWDALAVAAGVPLATFIGASRSRSLPTTVAGSA